MKPVRSKVDFVRRYKLGEFGNASLSWDKFNQYWHSGYDGLVHFRNKVAGGRTWYNLDRRAAWDLIFELKGDRPYGTRDQAPEYGNLYFSAMAPHDTTVLQGEVQRTHRGLELRYTLDPAPMRDAFKKQDQSVSGLASLMLLKSKLPPRDIEWLMYLLDEYDDHVVEFSTFGVEWGTVPGFRTVYWEVRYGY